jgi:hypothetical protein
MQRSLSKVGKRIKERRAGESRTELLPHSTPHQKQRQGLSGTCYYRVEQERIHRCSHTRCSALFYAVASAKGGLPPSSKRRKLEALDGRLAETTDYLIQSYYA